LGTPLLTLQGFHHLFKTPKKNPERKLKIKEKIPENEDLGTPPPPPGKNAISPCT
jgi:hypothetical protein